MQQASRIQAEVRQAFRGRVRLVSSCSQSCPPPPKMLQPLCAQVHIHTSWRQLRHCSLPCRVPQLDEFIITLSNIARAEHIRDAVSLGPEASSAPSSDKNVTGGQAPAAMHNAGAPSAAGAVPTPLPAARLPDTPLAETPAFAQRSGRPPITPGTAVMHSHATDPMQQQVLHNVFSESPGSSCEPLSVCQGQGSSLESALHSADSGFPRPLNVVYCRNQWELEGV